MDIVWQLVIGIPIAAVAFAATQLKNEIFVTKPPAGSGQIVVAGDDARKYICNFPDGYYRDEDGEWVPELSNVVKEKLGILFKLTGYTFYGFYPFRKIYKFQVFGSKFVSGVITPTKGETTSSFKEYYDQAVEVEKIELKGESEDAANTWVNISLLFTVKITNIWKAVFKFEPYNNIVFTEMDSLVNATVSQYFKGKKYSEFQVEPKGKGSPFYNHVIDTVNGILEEKLGMSVTSLNFEGYEEIGGMAEERQKLEALALKQKGQTDQADVDLIIDTKKAQGDKAGYEALVTVFGKNEAAEIMKTKSLPPGLKVYQDNKGSNPPSTAIILGDEK